MEKKFSTMTLLLIPVGIAINVIGGQMASVLRLPLYLDIIGTITIGLIGGIIPGVLVGLLTNLINAIFTPTMLPYVIVSVAFGFLSGVLSKKGMFLSKKKVAISGVLLALVAVALATPITAFVMGGITGGGNSVIIVTLQSMGFNLLTATLISTFCTEMLDKLLTVFICYGIVRSMSSRYLSKFPLGHIYINTEKASQKREYI